VAQCSAPVDAQHCSRSPSGGPASRNYRTPVILPPRIPGQRVGSMRIPDFSGLPTSAQISRLGKPEDWQDEDGNPAEFRPFQRDPEPPRPSVAGPARRASTGSPGIEKADGRRVTILRP